MVKKYFIFACIIFLCIMLYSCSDMLMDLLRFGTENPDPDPEQEVVPTIVKSYQKISDTAGGFTGTLDDGDNFGSSVTNTGDLDSDGIEDIVVGAPDDYDGGIHRGAVWVLFLE